MLSIPITSQLSTLALAIALSASSALAQQPVRRTATKTTVRSRTTVTKSRPTVAKKPAVAKSTALQTQPAVSVPAPGPVAAQQAEPAAQPAAKAAPTGKRATTMRNGHHLYLNAGLGLVTYYGGGLPLGVSAEVDVKNNFSVGGSIDYFRYNHGYYSGGYHFIYGGARASYHLGQALNVRDNRFDPYIGATLGFRYAGYSNSYGYYDGYSNGYNSGLFVGIHVGARYLFSPKIGAFTEVGYGVSALKLGLTAKF